MDHLHQKGTKCSRASLDCLHGLKRNVSWDSEFEGVLERVGNEVSGEDAEEGEVERVVASGTFYEGDSGETFFRILDLGEGRRN